MLDNEQRAMYGEAAIQAGAPDHGRNGVDYEGVFTDAGDCIANILHRLVQAHPSESLDERLEEARDVFRRADLHFTAEIEGGDGL